MNIKRNNYRALIPIEKCSMCNITAEEIGESNIHVDHKDYHHSNNEISNLWTLCSYCHSICDMWVIILMLNTVDPQ